MDSGGSGFTAVTSDAFYNVLPDWSPDGQMIIYSSGQDNKNLQIHIIGVDGSHEKQVTNSPVNSSEADWSPVLAGR